MEDTVKRAAALLDRAKPGWEDLIDTETLDLNRANRCILGQIYGNYATPAGYPRFRDDAGSEAYEVAEAFRDAYDHEWLDEIATRREARQLTLDIDLFEKELVNA